MPSTTATSESARLAGLAGAGSPIRVEDLREHTSTWGEPISIDYRGVRVTTHAPNSSGVVALELLGLLERFEPPGPGAFGPEGVADARWIHLHLEAAKVAMADRDAHLTDPAAREVPVEMLLDRDRLADLAAKIDLTRASAPRAASNPVGGGTVYLATVDGAGNAVSLIESNYLGFGSGVVDPGDRDPLPEPRQLLQPGRGPPERARAREAHA